MVESVQYDALVIGSGQAAGQLGDALADAGRRTLLVERAHLGGTCVNVGCTPTKTMVASARVAYLARRAGDYGVDAGPVSVDMARVRARKRAVVEQFGGGLPASGPRKANLDLLVGEARFIGEREVEVILVDGGVRRVAAEQVFINTGARPSQPAIPGLDRVAVLDSTSIMELDEVPRHLVVIGGGYIGLEFGQMFRRFGSAVTIVHRGERLLSREDPDVADAVAAILREDGLEVRTEASPTALAPAPDGGIEVRIRDGAGESVLNASHVLLAVGRVPNTDALNPAAAGIELDGHGFIRVNERLETTAPGVWALGDVKGGPAFTHISYDDHRIVVENLLRGGQRTTRDRMVPYTVFIDPQLGRVGVTEAQARRDGRRVRVTRAGMDSFARAIETGETRGFVKVIVDAATDRLLGCAVLGIEGGEIMSVLQVAMMGDLPYTALRDATFAHPTLAESLNNLFWEWDAE